MCSVGNLRRKEDSCTNIHGTCILVKRSDGSILFVGALDCDLMRLGNVTWHRTGNRWENRPNQRRTRWVTNIQELAATLSTTCKSEHAHANWTTSRSPTATERCPPEMAAAILKTSRCYVRRFEGISIHAFEIETLPHVHDVGCQLGNLGNTERRR